VRQIGYKTVKGWYVKAVFKRQMTLNYFIIDGTLRRMITIAAFDTPTKRAAFYDCPYLLILLVHPARLERATP
jgi:hypothetical protein